MCRKVAALLLLLPFLAACGSSSAALPKTPAATLADIKVSGPSTAKPHVSFHAPLHFTKLQRKVLLSGPGKGDVVKPNSVVTVDYAAFNASDGKEYDSSWQRGKPATFLLNDTNVISGLVQGLVGTSAGDRVLIGIPAKDAYDPTGNGSSVHRGDSVIFVVDVRKVQTPLSEATGTKQQVPGDVPRLTYDAQGHPQKFVATKQTPKSVKKLGVYPLIKGHGPVVKSGQTVTVQYVGQIYPDGKVFDSSWSRSPFTFTVGAGQVIPGWDKGLIGQRVGSRVILVIPSALGYGSTGSGSDIPPNADLIFAIDILQAS